MAYIHNQQQIKLDECEIRKQKEMFMKYGYGCPGNQILNSEDKESKKSYPILEEVEKILSGARRSSYGAPKDSFTRIAQYWNVYLTHKRDNIDKAAQEEDLPYEFLRGAYLTPKDAAMMMALFKIAREENKHSKDNIMDAIGYLTLANEMEE